MPDIQLRAQRARSEQSIFTPDEIAEALRQLDKEHSHWEQEFRGVQSHLMFIGYQRSGHSLVGALLDAHPDAIVAHELNVIEMLQRGLTRTQIFFMELLNSREFGRIGRIWGEYRYWVPHQYQGRYEKLRVIGDKKGGMTSIALAQHPDLVARVRAELGPSVRFLHVIRDPMDNIATILLRRKLQTLRDAIDLYFSLCDAVQSAIAQFHPGEYLEVYNDDLIANPQCELKRICKWLDLSTPDDYLDACASIVVPSKSLTRHKVRWSNSDLQEVRRRAERYYYLKRYEIRL